jgi:hypothetical protein
LTAVRVYSPLWNVKNPEPIYVPVSRLNNLRENKTASKNLARVGDLGIYKTTGSKTKKKFYHHDPNNNKSNQKITVAKNISLSKDNLENLKGIHFNYKNSNPNNPMQISFGIHTSGMKFHIPIEHFNEKKNLRALTQPPSETIDFATSLILQKGPLYLVKRILGLPFDKNWRLVEVGKRNLIQRRFHKNLNKVNNINIVFSRELDDLVVLEENLVRLPSDDEELRLKVSCNLRLSRGRFSNDIILAQGELPVKFFNSSGHWVLQIDLKEYLHSHRTLFLEELLLFIPANTNEIIAGRVVSSLIFGKQGKGANSPNIFTGVNGDEYTQDQRIFATMDSPNDVINKLGKSRKRIFLNLSNLKDVIKNRSGWGFFSKKSNVIEEVYLFVKPKKPGPKSSFFMSEPYIVFAKSGPLKNMDDYLKIHRKSRNRFHQEAINRKKDDSTIRILFLGGSIMAGLGAGPSTTFPLLFKGMLKSIGFSAGGKKFDIVNAGQPGNTTYGYLYQYDKTDAFAGNPWDTPGYFLKTPTDNARFTLKDLKADIVVIAPVYNDQIFFNGDPTTFEQLYENKVSINQVLKTFRENFVFQYNAIGHYIYKSAYGYLHNKALIKNTPYTENQNLRLYKNRLRLLVKKILKDSKKMVFLLFPAKEKDPYYHYYLNDKKIFNEIAEEFNFPVYDLNKNNGNKNREGYWYDYIHPSGMGYNDYAVKFFNLLFSEKSPYLKINWEDH